MSPQNGISNKKKKLLTYTFVTGQNFTTTFKKFLMYLQLDIDQNLKNYFNHNNHLA
jgi:hypothetical protein